MRISLFKEGAQAHETRLVEEVREMNDIGEDLFLAICSRPWAPGIFKDGIRSNKNLEEIEWLVLDIDDGCTLERARLEFSGFDCMIATTKSHQKEKNGITCDRFRVIMPLLKPARTDAEFKEYWFAAKQRWPFIDDACKDSARFFYPCNDVEWIQTGAVQAFADRVIANTAGRVSVPKQTSSTNKGKLSRATLEFIANSAPDGEWHAKLFKATMDFKEQGYTQDEATEKLTKITGLLDLHDEQTIEDVYANREPKYEARVFKDLSDWPVMVATKDGLPKPDMAAPENYKHWFKHMGFTFTLNELSGQVFKGNRALKDSDYADLFIQSKDWGFKCGKDMIIDLITQLATFNSFHPFKMAIEQEQSNNHDYIGELFNTLTLQEGADVEQSKAWFTKWFVGIAAKVYSPGAQNFVLTFLGAQGIGKSRWLSKLDMGIGCYGEGSIDPSNKDHEIRHISHIIWHIPELEYTTGKREAGALKDYLTKEVVTVRPAYARTTMTGRSTCSFCASVNNHSFLIDQTGNRRFVTIPLKAIDADHKVPVKAVFAQALHMYKNGYQYWLTPEEVIALNEVNEEYQQETELQVLLKGVEPGDMPYNSLEVFQILGIANPSAAQLRELGVLMAKKGIEQKRIGRAKIRHYYCENLRALVLPTVKSNANN